MHGSAKRDNSFQHSIILLTIGPNDWMVSVRRGAVGENPIQV